MDKELQVEIANVLQRGEDVATARRVESNIISTIEQLEICLPVFKMYQKLQDQLAEKRYEGLLLGNLVEGGGVISFLIVLFIRRYYPALKSLEQLEHTYLPQVSRYRFTLHFRDCIPK